MRGSVGLSKGLLVRFFFASVCSACTTDGHKETCLGGSYVLTYVTPTIQAISQYKAPEDGGKYGLVRGRIEFLTPAETFIGGYLSTRYFAEDGLTELAWEFDKEGFFVIDKGSGQVISGLSGEAFFKHLESTYKQKAAEFFKPESLKSVRGCGSRE